MALADDLLADLDSNPPTEGEQHDLPAFYLAFFVHPRAEAWAYVFYFVSFLIY